jgi:hypothetical protein
VPESNVVAFLWRGGRGERPSETRNYERLQPMTEALVEVGVGVEHVLYSDERRDSVRSRLNLVDGVLVWVDPIAGDEDRSALDAVLREVSARGVWVSAHPDVIDKMGTKEVLYRTRHLGWGTDTDLYLSAAELAERLPQRLPGGARVLKQSRGNGGIGVWKVMLAEPIPPRAADISATSRVLVQHAAPRDAFTENVSLGEFLRRWDARFAHGQTVIDQRFATRLPDGMVRAYLVRDRVVGFALQRPDPSVDDPALVLGMPSAKVMSNEDDPTYAAVRDQLERQWVPGLLESTALGRDELPLLWDADFLRGDTDETCVLCEINASSVLPFPPHAPRALAHTVVERFEQHRR